MRDADPRPRPRSPTQPRSAISHRNKPCGCPEFDRAISRRSFLKRAGVAGLVAGIASETAFTRLAFGATPYTGDVLVILSLRGGFDGLQAVVPAAEPHYSNYRDLRPNVGIPERSAAPAGRNLRAAPGPRAAQAALRRRHLRDRPRGGDGGTRTGRTSPRWKSWSGRPPGPRCRTGWIDRVLGLREESSVFQGVQMGTVCPPPRSSGRRRSSRCGRSTASVWLPRGTTTSASAGTPRSAACTTARSAVLRAPATAALDALEHDRRDGGRWGTPRRTGPCTPTSDLGRALTRRGRLIKQDVGLQVASVDYGDWDMHAGMGDVSGGWMVDHLTELAGAMAAFATDLGSRMAGVTRRDPHRVRSARRGERLGGTDHGYGQVVFLLGGGVRGGAVHGTWPGLAPADLVDGDLDATTDYRIDPGRDPRGPMRGERIGRVLGLPGARLGPPRRGRPAHLSHLRRTARLPYPGYVVRLRVRRFFPVWSGCALSRATRGSP